MTDSLSPKGTVTADENLRNRLAEFVKKNSVKQAAIITGVSAQTLKTILASLPVRKSNLVVVRMHLDKLAPVDASDSMKGGDHGNE